MTNPNAAAEPALSNRALVWIAFVWGVAEATVFFIVPDVLLTRIALRNLRTSLVAAVSATIGAVLAGIALWIAARHDAGPSLLKFFLHLPGVYWTLVSETARALHEQGAIAFFTGALRGAPYKLFAVHAGVQGMGLPSFVAASLLARFARFALSSLIAWSMARALSFLSDRAQQHLHTILWTTFYAIYLSLMR